MPESGPDAQSGSTDIGYTGDGYTAFTVAGFSSYCDQVTPATLQENFGISKDVANSTLFGLTGKGGDCGDVYLSYPSGCNQPVGTVPTSRIEFPDGSEPFTLLFFKGGKGYELVQGEAAQQLDADACGNLPASQFTVLGVGVEGRAKKNLLQERIEKGDLEGAAKLIRVQVVQGQAKITTTAYDLILGCGEQLVMDAETQEVIDIFLNQNIADKCKPVELLEQETAQTSQAALSVAQNSGEATDAGSTSDTISWGDTKDGDAMDTTAHVGAESGGCNTTPFQAGEQAAGNAVGIMVGCVGALMLAKSMRGDFNYIAMARYMYQAFGIVPNGVRMLFGLATQALTKPMEKTSLLTERLRKRQITEIP